MNSTQDMLAEVSHKNIATWFCLSTVLASYIHTHTLRAHSSPSLGTVNSQSSQMVSNKPMENIFTIIPVED